MFSSVFFLFDYGYEISLLKSHDLIWKDVIKKVRKFEQRTKKPVSFSEYLDLSYNNIITDDDMFPINKELTFKGQYKNSIPFSAFKNLELTTLFFVFYYQMVAKLIN